MTQLKHLHSALVVVRVLAASYGAKPQVSRPVLTFCVVHKSILIVKLHTRCYRKLVRLSLLHMNQTLNKNVRVSATSKL